MQKPKSYDWKDSNMALVGSDEDKAARKCSAETEEAWKAINPGKNMFYVWRIVKFQVKPWPRAEYGQFYDGDSYIILNIYTEEGKEDLKYDIHFWIGKYSTADEYGTAAYKTVELDNYFDDKPVQHREVQDHESGLFRSYFKSITIMKGGADSGFRHVKTQEYKPRLFHFHGDRKGISCVEVCAKMSKLDPSDVFILDSGNNIYQWNGKTCNKDEKWKALQYVQDLKCNRGTAKSETLDEDDTETNHEFYAFLRKNENVEDDDDEVPSNDAPVTKSLHRLSDATGQLEIRCMEKGEIHRRTITDDDVWIVDSGSEIFVYIGDGCSSNEKRKAMEYAHEYLKGTDHPLISVTAVKPCNKRSMQCMYACFDD